MRGVSTENNVNTTGPRILVGHFNDPKFGNMDVRSYGNFAPPIIHLNPTTAATPDSLVLEVAFDFYRYGPAAGSTHRLQIFEVLDTIQANFGYIAGKDTVDRRKNYYNNSTIAVSPLVIGDVTFNVDPAYFDESYAINHDTDTTNNRIFKVRIKITSPTMMNNLMHDLIYDSAMIANFAKFSGKYKGFAFIMNQGDQILGINPDFRTPLSTTKNTRLSLYYTDGGVQTHALFLLNHNINQSTGLLSPVTSFTTINADYTATELSGIQPYQPFIPFSNFYAQSGTALIAKYDLTNFYKYVDTIQNAVFNSAELVVTNSSTRPPSQAQLRILDDNNFFRSPYIDTLLNGIVTQAPDPYFNKMASTFSYGPLSSPTIDINTDIGTPFPIYVDDFNLPQLFITNFIQAIYQNRSNSHRVKSFALMPEANQFQYSVNTLILDKTAFIRVYYSKPVIEVR